MRASSKKGAISALIFSALFFCASIAWSCTGIQLRNADGTFVNGRTVEFGMSLDIAGLIVPRGFTFTGTLPDGSAGMSYQSKYAAIGSSTFGSPAIVDGVNEKGLSIGMFYFPEYATYATITDENKHKALSPVEFPNWILTQFATVDEVREGVKTVVIAPTTPPGWPGLPPFHYIVYDNTGKSLVIEPTDGKLVVFENPIGVFTNSPTFDWHLTNLSNYLNLSPLNAPDKSIDGMKLQSFGQGSGLHGMPGDFTPPSRFVRAAIFSATAIPSKNAQEGVLQAFHILNQFDIPAGAVKGQSGNQTEYDTTIATTVKDPQNLKYYIRTYDDQGIRMFDLNRFDLNAKTLKTISYKGSQPITDISMKAVSKQPTLSNR